MTESIRGLTAPLGQGTLSHPPSWKPLIYVPGHDKLPAPETAWLPGWFPQFGNAA